MDSQEIIAVLCAHDSGPRARGVHRAALFGSVACGEARPDSDIDILVEFDPDCRITVFDYVGVQRYISELFDRTVDVIDREALKPHLRQSVRSAVYAF